MALVDGTELGPALGFELADGVKLGCPLGAEDGCWLG